MLCACAHHAASGTFRGSTGRTAEFFFFIKKEPFALTAAVQFKPFVPAESLKACALIFRHCCPESPDWDSDGESWSESEGLSSSDFREHNVEILALHVIGVKLVRRKGVPFPGGLGTCQGGLELPRWPGYVVPGNARGLVAGLPLPGKPTVTASESPSLTVDLL